MIAALAQDLVTKIQSYTGNVFGTAGERVGLSVGGRDTDPMMTHVTLPAAWAIYVSTKNENPDPKGHCSDLMSVSFVVKVYVEYKNDTDLLTVGYPALEATIKAINGQQGPAGSQRWKYETTVLDEILANRLVYDLYFSNTSAV